MSRATSSVGAAEPPRVRDMATARVRTPARHAGPPRLRIRYQRLSAAVSACGITLVAVLGGMGLLPDDTGGARLVADTATLTGAEVHSAIRQALSGGDGVQVDGQKFDRTDASRDQLADAALAVPFDSGEGRRVVFDQSAQRVWLVGDDGEALRTYLVSGSLDDNLDPGTFSVYSRSEQAWGIDDSGTMKYFVRFTQGTNGAAIGFHDIPIDDGALVQTAAQLGTPQSHGCIRQLRKDAIALWDFAPIGTEVDVVA